MDVYSKGNQRVRHLQTRVIFLLTIFPSSPHLKGSNSQPSASPFQREPLSNISALILFGTILSFPVSHEKCTFISYQPNFYSNYLPLYFPHTRMSGPVAYAHKCWLMSVFCGMYTWSKFQSLLAPWRQSCLKSYLLSWTWAHTTVSPQYC